MQLKQLIEECKKNSLTAQQYLFSKYGKRFFVFCKRYVRTKEEAEECLMTAFLKIFDSVKKFEFKNDIATESWMQKIMLNECLMALRKKQSFLVIAEDEISELATTEDIIDQLSANEILELITQLPTGYRTVFNLFVMEQMSHKEIAELLKISEGTSKSQLNKARQLLQQLLQQKNVTYATGENR